MYVPADTGRGTGAWYRWISTRAWGRASSNCPISVHVMICTIYVEPVPHSMSWYSKHYQILSDNLWDNVYQGSHRDCKTWKMKVVIEKSWNMKKWPKVMEFV